MSTFLTFEGDVPALSPELVDAVRAAQAYAQQSVARSAAALASQLAAAQSASQAQTIYSQWLAGYAGLLASVQGAVAQVQGEAAGVNQARIDAIAAIEDAEVQAIANVLAGTLPPFATEQQALVGSNNATIMTPLRVVQAVAQALAAQPGTNAATLMKYGAF